MKYYKIILLFLFGFCLNASITAQVVFEEIDVYQGTVWSVQFVSPIGPPQIKESPSGDNELILASINGDTYIFHYVPEVSFLGDDGFTIEVIKSWSPPNPPVITTYNFQVHVVASMVDTKDDFIHMTSMETITINPLDNDETSSDGENLTVKIAQVQYGTATVNGDQTISYTPQDNNPDYIIYNVKDNYGTVSTSTIYISHVAEALDDITVGNYNVASGKSAYIILPADNFILEDSELEFGELEEINSFTYAYHSFNNISGGESFQFANVDGKIFQADISIYAKYTDDGYVRDDVFYSASNTNIHFDVTLNDIVDQYVISDYSQELLHLGSGVFSYTPPPYFSGIKTFFYTADNGIEEETGTIEVVVSNWKPVNYFEYNLSTPQNQPRIIEYDVPLGTEYFEITSFPIHGSIEVFSEDESVDVGCEEGIQKVFALYTPNNDFVGIDNVIIRYCASDNNLCNDLNLEFDVVATNEDDCICVDDCVWPGDANGDGKVSVVDALAVGRYMGSAGPTRTESSYGDIYKGASASNWLGKQINGKNIKHIDSDGDGLVSTNDLDVVIQNYGEINSIISNDIFGIKNIPFFLTTEVSEVDSGDVLELNIIIGTEAFPAIDIHGVAFAINLDPGFVDSASVELVYLENEYFVKGGPYVDLTHQPADGIIHSAGAKTNSLGSTGSGIVATLSFIVEEDAEGLKDPVRSSSELFEDVVTSIYVSNIIVEDSKGYKYALPNSSLDIVVKSGETNKNLHSDITVSPNPSSGIFKIASKTKSSILDIQVYTTTGNLMLNKERISLSQSDIDLSHLSSGLYLLKVNTEFGTEVHKIYKQ